MPLDGSTAAASRAPATRALTRVAERRSTLTHSYRLVIGHEIGAMIGGLVDNEILPGNLRQDIIERTDGIPLFVEGDDEGFAGSRSRKRGKAGDCGRSVCSAGSPRKPARFPHGTARSARGAPPRKWRKSAQRLGMSFPCSACGRRGEARVGTQFSSRPAHYSRFDSWAVAIRNLTRSKAVRM